MTEHGDYPWHLLTTKEGKPTLYANDSYFREAWADATTVWEAQAVAVASQIAVIVFKPETVVTRRIGTALAFLRECGFLPVAHRRVRYTRHMNRAAWRYQFQSDLPTVDRLVVSDLAMSATDALAVVFRDAAVSDMPTSVRLNTFKGSMTPAQRGAGTLRTLVAGPNRMLSGVHIPDEPADVLRECGILFAADDRYALFVEVAAHLTNDATATAYAAATALYDEYAATTLDPHAALARLDALLAARGGAASRDAAVRYLCEMIAAVRDGAPLSWRPFTLALAGAGIALPLWDRVLLGTEFIRHNEE